MALPTIGTLWIGDALSWLEQLCLQSFLDNGHEVVLYAYSPIKGVPDGVKIADANDILPSDNIIRHARTGSPAYHADVFRLLMLKQTNYIWADTDALCCKPWDIKPTKHFHGWISDDISQVNNGVLRLPKTSKTLKAMLKFTSDPYPIPPWLEPETQEEYKRLKDKGDGVHVSLMPWGVWGPDALTWFLKDTGEIEHSQPGHVIYPVPFKLAGAPLNPNRIDRTKGFLKDDTLSIHFWGRRFRNIAAKYGGVPAKGCYVERLLAKHKIDPAPTAHMMKSRKSADEFSAITPLDTSMFDDRDIANLVLQRSEVGDTDAEVSAWMEGDDAPLMAYARANRDNITQNVMEIMAIQCNQFVKQADELAPRIVADIGCGYGFGSLLMQRRYDAKIVLIDIEQSEDRHFGFADAGSGYSNLDKAHAFLIANGVPEDKIITLNPTKQDVADIGTVDMAFSLLACGFHFPASTYETFFKTQIKPGGFVILDIRKSSGGIPYLKGIGEIEVLEKHAKHSTVLTRPA